MKNRNHSLHLDWQLILYGTIGFALGGAIGGLVHVFSVGFMGGIGSAALGWRVRKIGGALILFPIGFFTFGIVAGIFSLFLGSSIGFVVGSILGPTLGPIVAPGVSFGLIGAICAAVMGLGFVAIEQKERKLWDAQKIGILALGGAVGFGIAGVLYTATSAFHPVIYNAIIGAIGGIALGSTLAFIRMKALLQT